MNKCQEKTKPEKTSGIRLNKLMEKILGLALSLSMLCGMAGGYLLELRSATCSGDDFDMVLFSISFITSRFYIL